MPTHFPDAIIDAAKDYAASELETVRRELLANILKERTDLVRFGDFACTFLRHQLDVDRIYLCDSRDGDILAGWSKGKNIVRASDWDPDPLPLDMDRTLQRAVESDEVVINPVDGIGADLAVPVRFPDREIWLLVLDQTDIAREFNRRDRALIRFTRDLLVLKSRLSA